jgi:hypothetical protein
MKLQSLTAGPHHLPPLRPRHPCPCRRALAAAARRDGRAAIPEAPGKRRAATRTGQHRTRSKASYELAPGDGGERAQVKRRLASGGAGSQRGRGGAVRPRAGSSTSGPHVRQRVGSSRAGQQRRCMARPLWCQQTSRGQRRAAREDRDDQRPARGTSEVAAKRAGRSRGGSDTLSSCLLRSVGRRCGDVGTGSMHRVSRAMARGVDRRSVEACGSPIRFDPASLPASMRRT